MLEIVKRHQGGQTEGQKDKGKILAYRVGLRDFDQIETTGETIVTVDNILQRRFLPVNVNDRPVDIPLHDGSRRRNANSKVDVELFGTRHKRITGYIFLDRRDEMRCLVGTALCISCGSACGVTSRCTVIGEDCFNVSVIFVSTACALHFGTEPVVAYSLVGIDNDVVALTYIRQYGLGNDSS